MKRAQASTNQVFIFILVVVVISLTILLGYKIINNLRSSNEKMQLASFSVELEKQIKGIDSGETYVYTARLPPKYDMLCFYTETPTNPEDPLTTFIQKEIMEKGSTVFLISKGGMLQSWKFDQIVSEELLCFNNSQKYVLEGKGKKVYVKKP